MSTVEIVATLSAALTGLLAGGLLFGALVVGRAERYDDDLFWVRLHQAMNRTADPFMPRLAVATLAANVGLVVVLLVGEADPVAVPVAVCAVLGTAAAIVGSVRVNVPLNKRIDSWSAAAPPAELDYVRQRWSRYHVVRTVSALVAFAGAVSAGAVG